MALKKISSDYPQYRKAMLAEKRRSRQGAFASMGYSVKGKYSQRRAQTANAIRERRKSFGL